MQKPRERRLIPLTVRLSPQTHDRLNAIIRKRPHMSINVLINEMLEKELACDPREARRG